MTFVVTENCIRCKHGDCVDVCPVDCFHEGPNFMVINPDECIDCNLCVSECPAQAIYAEHDVPEDLHDFIALNEKLARKWPIATERPTPCEDAQKWDGQPNKRQYLQEE